MRNFNATEYFDRIERRAKRQPRAAAAKKIYRDLREKLQGLAPLKGTPLGAAAIKQTFDECEAKQKQLVRKKEKRKK